MRRRSSRASTRSSSVHCSTRIFATIAACIELYATPACPWVRSFRLHAAHVIITPRTQESDLSFEKGGRAHGHRVDPLLLPLAPTRHGRRQVGRRPLFPHRGKDVRGRLARGRQRSSPFL